MHASEYSSLQGLAIVCMQTCEDDRDAYTSWSRDRAAAAPWGRPLWRPGAYEGARQSQVREVPQNATPHVSYAAVRCAMPRLRHGGVTAVA